MSYYVLSFQESGGGPKLEGAGLSLEEAKKLFSKVAFFTGCRHGDDCTRLSDDGKSVELC